MINLGAGLQWAPGWINYDRSRSSLIARRRILRRAMRRAHRLGLSDRRAPLDWPRATRVHDLTKGIPHAPESVDVVYSSHFLEHLSRDAATFVIGECFRVLRPTGELRIVVPDLHVLASAYVQGDRSYFRNAEATIADAFMTSLGLPLEQRRAPVLERLVRGVLRTDEGGHRWMYDAESLMQRAHEAGFTDVRPVAYRQGRCKAAAALDNQPRSSIYVEARKPGRGLAYHR